MSARVGVDAPMKENMVPTHLTASLGREVEARHLRHRCRQRGHATCDVKLLGG